MPRMMTIILISAAILLGIIGLVTVNLVLEPQDQAQAAKPPTNTPKPPPGSTPTPTPTPTPVPVAKSVSLIGGGTGNLGLDSQENNYIPMFDSFRHQLVEEPSLQQALPVGGTVSNLYVRLDRSPGVPEEPNANRHWLFTVRKNGVGGPVTCTVPDLGTTCSDISHSMEFAEGDLITIEADPSAEPDAPGPVKMKWTAKFTTENP